MFSGLYCVNVDLRVILLATMSTIFKYLSGFCMFGGINFFSHFATVLTIIWCKYFVANILVQIFVASIPVCFLLSLFYLSTC